MPQSSRQILGWLGAGILGVSGWLAAWADSPTTTGGKAAPIAAHREALSHWNGLVGGWRGTGQPRRGSPTGAWREDTAWAWSFSENETALVGTVTRGKLATTLKLTAGAQPGEYQIHWTSPEGTARTLLGKLADGKLVCESSPDEQEEVHRITLTPLNEQRTLILFEKRRTEQQSYTRIAEVGYTREGTRLAAAGGGQPECVVTGGLGTIKVEHKGQSYYVCCTGCKQAFDDDPEGILAEYQARRTREKAAGK
ncbi:MAG: YHS domain-containing protein [Planctomycetota bacterium]|nr:MAG: YHS domain-containing protein [Planctomycetota bacterium]